MLVHFPDEQKDKDFSETNCVDTYNSLYNSEIKDKNDQFYY
jgi:hypothetical protein